VFDEEAKTDVFISQFDSRIAELFHHITISGIMKIYEFVKISRLSTQSFFDHVLFAIESLKRNANGTFLSARTIAAPKKKAKKCTCKCRADINDNIPSQKTKQPRYAFGTAVGSNCQEASKEAKRLATKELGAQPKHVGCKCS